MEIFPKFITVPGWIITFFLIYSQCIPAFWYDLGVKMGTQDPEEVVTPVGTAFWYGFCLADLVCYVPLLIIGLWYHQSQVLAAALGITMYWPIVCGTAVLKARNVDGWKLDSSQYWIPLLIIEAWAISSFFYLALVNDAERSYNPIPLSSSSSG